MVVAIDHDGDRNDFGVVLKITSVVLAFVGIVTSIRRTFGDAFDASSIAPDARKGVTTPQEEQKNKDDAVPVTHP